MIEVIFRLYFKKTKFDGWCKQSILDHNFRKKRQFIRLHNGFIFRLDFKNTILMDDVNIWFWTKFSKKMINDTMGLFLDWIS
jgi:hypothetical protein